MLKTRVLTALVLAPLAFLLVFGASTYWFGIVFAALMLIGSWEFKRLGAMERGVFGWLLVIIQATVLALLFMNADAMLRHSNAFLTAACLVWLVMLVRLVIFRPGLAPDFQYRIVTFASALASVSFCWIALYVLRAQENGSWWILVLFLIIWSADTGAYFVGKSMGKAKLAQRISPSKTREGLYGGLLTAVIVSTATVYLVPAIHMDWQKLVPLTLVTALVSVCGDLFISLHKRTTGLKDSGALFPGHGGVLDRFDSLLSGAPFFVLGITLMGI